MLGQKRTDEHVLILEGIVFLLGRRHLAPQWWEHETGKWHDYWNSFMRPTVLENIQTLRKLRDGT